VYRLRQRLDSPHGDPSFPTPQESDPDTRMAEPILLEVQQREQEILEYLSRDPEQPQLRATTSCPVQEGAQKSRQRHFLPPMNAD
jgi:hypothetical protein